MIMKNICEHGVKWKKLVEMGLVKNIGGFKYDKV